MQVFFDKAYVIPFQDVLQITSDPRNEGVVFSIERDVKNQGKTTIKINVQVGKEILGRIDMPQHRSALKELARGRLLFYVTFHGATSTLPYSLRRYCMAANHLAYLQRVGEKHRKEYGQFFTNPEVARFMVRWVLQSGAQTLFDPAFGLGAFFHPVADDPSIAFTGNEIDPKILDFWTDGAAGRKAEIANEDYLLSWGKSHANIVCNPPYTRFQKFIGRDAVFRAFVDNLGLRLSGYTNAASAFLLKSLSELNGRLAYVMPLEFLNTGYGTIVKKRLIENGHLVAMININCEKDIFPDALTSVGIVLYDASRHHAHVDFHTADSVPALVDILKRRPTARVALNRLNPESKWLSYFQTHTFAIDHGKAIPLNHYGRFSRGIATGANEFFVLRPSRARTLGINGSEVVPCITKSTQIRHPVFVRADYEDLVRNDAPVLLFSVGKAHSKRAAAYIQTGEQRGVQHALSHKKPKTLVQDGTQTTCAASSRGFLARRVQNYSQHKRGAQLDVFSRLLSKYPRHGLSRPPVSLLGVRIRARHHFVGCSKIWRCARQV